MIMKLFLRHLFFQSETMMKIRNRKKGFTLIELMVAMSLASFLFLIVGNILVFCHKSFADNELERSSQASINYIKTMVSRKARFANSLDISVPQSRQLIIGSDRFYRENNDLMYDSGSGREVCLISGVLSEFKAEKTAKSISVKFETDVDGKINEYDLFYAFRN